MLFKPGNAGSSGWSTTATDGPEFIDITATVTIAAGTTLNQGQVLCYDATNVPNSSGADKVVLPTSGNAGKAVGVYQGPPIVNPSSTASLVQTITIRKYGYGVVLAQTTASGTGSTAVTVGAYLIIGANGTSLVDAYAGPATVGVTIGMAVATGSHTAYGATILPGATVATGLVNALITLD